MSLVRADARQIPLVDGCVQTCVTSPPYFGLRDYGSAKWVGGDVECEHVMPSRQDVALATASSTLGGGKKTTGHLQEASYRDNCGLCGAQRIDPQIGLEPTPDAYVQSLLTVFAEVWRVLKADGTLWLNLGSSYAGGIPGSGGATAKQVTNAGSFFDGKRPSQFRPRRRALACGSDGTALQDSTGVDSVYSGLCDGCLSDWLSHRDRIAGSGQQSEQSAQPLSQTVRDSGHSDCVVASPDASPLGALASTTLESWRQHRGACSRCDSRASDLLAAGSYAGDALAFWRMAESTLDTACHESDARMMDTDASGMAWHNYTTKLKQKDLIPIPWMVAMSLQAAGWYLRSDIIWSKPNPMPESVTDRPTKAHEYIFLLSKQERYFYDADAVQETATGRAPGNVAHKHTAAYRSGDEYSRTKGGLLQVGAREQRNKRSVWHVATQPYAGSHFATFPEALIEPCILAGSRPGDLVLDPFVGSGTVGTVCERFGRRWVGTDLSYQQLSQERTRQRGLRFLA